MLKCLVIVNKSPVTRVLPAKSSPSSANFLWILAHQVILKSYADHPHGLHLQYIVPFWSLHYVSFTFLNLDTHGLICIATSLFTSTALSPTQPATALTAASTGTGDTSKTQSNADPSGTSTSEPGSKSSQAWIAGAVVGPLVGIAAVTLLLWLLYSRRKRRQESLTNQSLIAQGYTGGQTAYAQPVPAYADTGHEAYKHPHEIHEMQATHSSQHPQELPGSEHARFR
jgi:hypothetical protein